MGDPDLYMPIASPHLYLTQSAFKVIVQKSIPTQIRRLILHISKDKGYVDGFLGELIFAKRYKKHFM